MDLKLAIELINSVSTLKLINYVSITTTECSLPLRLYTSFFIHPDRSRQAEYETCIRGNSFLEQHVFVDTDKAEEWVRNNVPTAFIHKQSTGIQSFKEMFSCAEDGYINIVANADILLNETIFRLKYFDLENTFLCIGRWEEDPLSKRIFPSMDRGSQDTWVWKNRIRNPESLDFNFGTPGCDNKLAYEMHSQGYKVANPSLDIISVHKHLTNIRSYPPLASLPPYATVVPHLVYIPNAVDTYTKNKSTFQKASCILHIGYPMKDLQEEFARNSDKYFFIHRDTSSLDATVLSYLHKHSPSFIFCQLQAPGILSLQTVMELYYSTYVVNWTGDARRPIPEWYKQYAPYFNVTLFSNETDVQEMRALGYRSDFLNIGYETQVYTPIRGLIPSADIVFMGNNYVDSFPLSKLRSDMVEALKKQFADKFAVYGIGWENAQSTTDEEHEANIYRGCKMAISLSHYDLERYFSDRMIRIMGCSTLCLAKWYPGIEKDFKDGVHLVVWKTIPELIEKIKYYLDHPEEAFVIGRGGCQQVIAEHTWKTRMEQLAFIMESNPRNLIVRPPPVNLQRILNIKGGTRKPIYF